jgi:diguanylate cyclase (GGDEF)-like protein
MRSLFPDDEFPAADVPLRKITLWFLRLGLWPGVAVITASTIAFSLLITALFMRIAELPLATQRVGFMVAFIVPAIVATVYGYLLLRMVSELEQARSLARQLTITDELTGTASRRYFLSVAAAEIDRAARHHTPLTLLLFDVDQFKTVNDEHGHAAGDEALRQVVAVCRPQLRASDLLARVGGDEFAVLLPQTDLAGGVALAERLRLNVESAPRPADGIPSSLTISIGVAAWQSQDATLDPLRERADRALYDAKAAGRNCVRSAQPA